MISDTSFIHLTDTHILSDGQRIFPQMELDTYPKFRAVMDAVAAMDTPPDFFIISGDLTHEGGEATYQRFKALVDELEKRFDAPVLCALGNHDRRVPFRAVMLDQHDTDEHTPYYYSRTIGGLRVIVLDTRVPEKETGALDTEQLVWLARELDTPFDGVTLIVLHHPPINGPLPILKGHGLTNADDLARVLQGHPIVGILCGHIHYNSIGSFNGIPCAAGAGVAFTLDPAATHGMRMMDGSGFNLINIHDGLMTVNPIVMPGEQRELFYYRPELHHSQH